MKTFPLGFSPQGKAAPLTEGHFYEGNASQTSLLHTQALALGSLTTEWPLSSLADGRLKRPQVDIF